MASRLKKNVLPFEKTWPEVGSINLRTAFPVVVFRSRSLPPGRSLPFRMKMKLHPRRMGFLSERKVVPE
jgi:hypothetical protein